MLTTRNIRKWFRLLVLAFLYFSGVILLHKHRETTNKTEEANNLKLEVLRSRMKDVTEGCHSSPLPRSSFLKNSKGAATVDSKFEQFYMNQHMKYSSKYLFNFPQLHLTWCLVPKVASTSWAQAFLNFEGFTTEELLAKEQPFQVTLRQLYRPIPVEHLNKSLNDSVKFLFVRHPFERLVSAYRNKLEDSNANEDGEYFYMNYGRKMVIKYRRPNNVAKNKPLRYNSVSDNGFNKDELEESQYIKEPSFSEFIEYIIHTDIEQYDEHWKPISTLCGVCDFKYDFILKYENFDSESKYFVNYLQYNSHLPKTFEVKWENKGFTDNAVTLTYMKQLSSEKLLKVYEKYKQDFEYFKYQASEFFE